MPFNSHAFGGADGLRGAISGAKVALSVKLIDTRQALIWLVRDLLMDSGEPAADK